MALCLNKQVGPAGRLDLRTIRRCQSSHEEVHRLAEVGLSETCQRRGLLNERLALLRNLNLHFKFLNTNGFGKLNA